ncbi:MAG: hypothetical protein KIT83_09745 [Bryobacterales bacterium]|nr:hypothetical protein [Bryobacterales bacterium]
MEWLILGALALAFTAVRRSVLNAASPRRLAARVGFAPVEAFASGPQDWFGGVVHGRRVAVGPAPLRVARPSLFRQTKLHLCIAVGVATRKPLGALAYRSHFDPSSLHRFEEAFRVERGDRLNPAAREAMLAFVRKGYAKPNERRRAIQGPDARNLRLCDRQRVPAEALPVHVLPDARTVLIHNHPRLHLSADEFGQLLNELSVVADALEGSARDSQPTEPNWPPARQ